jgi:hypothetical protein
MRIVSRIVLSRAWEVKEPNDAYHNEGGGLLGRGG